MEKKRKRERESEMGEKLGKKKSQVLLKEIRGKQGTNVKQKKKKWYKER